MSIQDEARKTLMLPIIMQGKAAVHQALTMAKLDEHVELFGCTFKIFNVLYQIDESGHYNAAVELRQLVLLKG